MSRFNLADIVRQSMPVAAVMARRVQAGIMAAWAAEARANLGRSNKTTAAYVGGLQPSSTSQAGVELLGTFPNMFEQGMGPGGVGTEGPYDLRDVLLKPTTRSIRFGPKGMYLNVPFDMSAAQIKALGGASALKQARALAPTLSPSQGGRTQWGGRLPPGLAPKMKEHHHSDPLAGIVRREAAYSTAAAPGSQSTYRKWRRITQWGKPWIHPGIRAAHIATRVMAQMGDIVRDAFEASR